MELPTGAACEDVQRVELSLLPTATYEVCISPGLMTSLRFDAPVVVELQDEVRFDEVVRGRQLLTLMPPPDMTPGERLRLSVQFADRESQQGVTFTLVAHRGQATRQVEVFRDKRTRDSYQQEIAQERARNQRLHEENQQLHGELEQLRVQRNQSAGLMGIHIAGALDSNGITHLRLSWEKDRPPENAISASTGTSFRSKNSVAVEVWVQNTSTEPWMAVGASLVTAGGEKMKEVRLYQDRPVPPEQTGAVFVEVAATSEEPQGAVTLILWEAGPRTVTAPDVMFP